MNLKSFQTSVQKSQKELYEFLTDVSNFKTILPDGLEEFEAREDSFKFALKGMPAIRLEFVEKVPDKLIKLKATSDNLPVFLTCKIDELNEKEAQAQLFIDADLNPMMAMMLKKPLQKLLDTLADKMGEL
jgi:carbon monoxide dehydrogenase subunit G